MLKYIIPRFPLADLRPLCGFALIGALIAGSYGVLHDHITFSIGPEYFYNFKFQQFAFADAGWGDRLFVSNIGFLATWWVGLIVAWILGRRCLTHLPRESVARQIYKSFAVVFVVALLAGLAGYGYGLWRGPDADYSYWHSTLSHYNVADHWSFMRVGFIHNASYIGGLVGLVLTYFLIRPERGEKIGA